MEQIEIWKDIEGYEGIYQVSTLGKVKCLGRIYYCGRGRKGVIGEKIMAMFDNGRGYLIVGLGKDGKQISNKAHRLVAKAFIENPENKKEVNHKNGVKTDNRVENLEWCTTLENAQHAKANGYRDNIDFRGEKSVCTKLKNRDVIVIKDLLKTNLYTLQMLAYMFGVSLYNIFDIKRGRTWAHIK